MKDIIESEEDLKIKEGKLITQYQGLQKAQSRYEMFEGIRSDEGYNKQLKKAKERLLKFQEEFAEYLI